MKLPCALVFSALMLLSAMTPEAAEKPADNMILIPAGSFLMGSLDTSGHPVNETPRHKVDLHAFLIDEHEVTNEMFAQFLNAVRKEPGFQEKRERWIVIRNDLENEQKKDWWPSEIIFNKQGFSAVRGLEKYPAVSLTWHAADAYCRWKGRRLPTEAEWEKAARGGLRDKEYPWGDELPTTGIVFRKQWTNNILPAPTEPARNYLPNAYGLYEMAGNVAEWCSDWYNSFYYNRSPQQNPEGPETGVSRVVRGGSWASNAESLRVAFRNFSLPDNRNSGVGFRCVKNP